MFLRQHLQHLQSFRPGSDRDVQCNWTKSFVHHFVHLGVEGNCHVIINFVRPVHGFTLETGPPVELCLWKLLCSCLIVPWKLLHNSFPFEQTRFVHWTTFGVTFQVDPKLVHYNYGFILSFGGSRRWHGATSSGRPFEYECPCGRNRVLGQWNFCKSRH